MAFYTSRVNEQGSEIERLLTGRTIQPSLSSACHTTGSEYSFENKHSVRYVNAAAYVEKTVDESDISSLNRDVKSKCGSSECDSISIPPLDLRSESCATTNGGYSFSCRKPKLSNDMAFKTWLSAKRKVMFDEAVRRKKEEEEKRKKEEERQRLAKIKFEEWIEAKKALLQRQKTNNENTESNPARIKHTEEEIQKRLAEWEEQKRLKEEERRIQLREEKERQREMELQRSELCNQAWKEWLAKSCNKPKPVPLNRGIFTLWGTIAYIFVNPNPWQSILPAPVDN